MMKEGQSKGKNYSLLTERIPLLRNCPPELVKGGVGVGLNGMNKMQVIIRNKKEII